MSPVFSCCRSLQLFTRFGCCVVVETLRELLPVDAVIIYFKLEVISGSVEGTDQLTHEGIFGEFLFRKDGVQRPAEDIPVPESNEGGAVFHNVLPGVLMFQALHVTEASLEGHAVTSYFKEEATARTIQVGLDAQEICRNLVIGFGSFPKAPRC